MHNLDQEINEAISNLLTPLPAERRQQRVADLIWVGAQVTGRFRTRTLPIDTHNLWRQVAKKVFGQTQSTYLTQLCHLLEQGFDSDLTGVHPKRMKSHRLLIGGLIPL